MKQTAARRNSRQSVEFTMEETKLTCFDLIEDPWQIVNIRYKTRDVKKRSWREKEGGNTL